MEFFFNVSLVMFNAYFVSDKMIMFPIGFLLENLSQVQMMITKKARNSNQ